MGTEKQMGTENSNRRAVAAQTWDAGQYAANGRFVADLAKDVVALLAPLPGERILDLGCGDGVLTEQIGSVGATVTGCDRDPSMLKAAMERGIQTVSANMTELPFEGEFDAVFSNAALHWTREQDAVLQGVHRALVSGGRFIAEMGGLGNIAAIRVALQAVLQRNGIDAEEAASSFFPSREQYRSLLEQNGFQVETMELIPRPTLLKSGMEAWLRTFRRTVLEHLPADRRDRAVAETVALLRPVLQDAHGTWWADYVRLRFRARKV